LRIVDRLDPVALERQLLERVDAAHPRGEPGSTLIVVPTARLAEHVQRRLAAVRPAWLGLEVLDFDRLTGEVLKTHADRPVRVATDRVLAAVLERTVRERPENAWARFARLRPGTLRLLQETMRDLREAGVEPSVVAEGCAGDAHERGLAQLYGAYHNSLEELAGSGWTDRAGRVRAATVHISEYCNRLQTVFVHGAYEWIGVNLDLLREMDRATDLTILLPAQFGSRVSSFAERFARNHLPGAADLEMAAEAASGQGRFDFGGGPNRAQPERRPGSPQLDALYDEESRPDPVDAGWIGFAHAQGPAAEVKFAVRSALRDVDRGCAPAEIAIVARNLGPYAAALEEIFDDESLPWNSSLRTPLRRRPLVRDFLLLLRVVDEQFPRRATVELLRSSRVNWPVAGSGCNAPPPADRIDAWTREAKVIGGFDDWTVELPRWAAEPTTYPGQHAEQQMEAVALAAERERGVDYLVDCLNTLIRDVDLAPRGWGEHAGRFRALLRGFFGGSEANDVEEDAAELDRLFDEMAQLESVAMDVNPVEFTAARSWLEQAVDASEPRIHQEDRGGIRVLDAMQMRGLTFDRLYLLGMNSDVFPRTPREDPVLDDAARARIAERSGRPLAQKMEAAGEERLLLALLLGSATEAVRVSWQRANESGKAVTPSLALRELARLRFGRPDLVALRIEALHIPSHPTQALQALLHEPGLLSPDDEMLLAVLSLGDPARAEGIRQRFPQLSPGLNMLAETQSWVRGRAEYDARIGPLETEPALSVSAMEDLGNCPLQFFFKRILRVRESDDEPSALAISSRDAGTGIHALLEEVYRALDDEGLFAPVGRAELVQRGRELLEERRDDVLGDLGRRLSRRLPLLWRERARSWAAVLSARVVNDLARIESLELKPLGFEESCSRRLDLGDDVGLRLSARFDRRLEGPDGVTVGDYKISKNVARRVDPTAMLKGTTLQAPLYRLLAGEDATVEMIGIHPELGEDDARVSFSGFEKEAQEASFRDTLRVLLQLRNGGNFPFNDDRHCQWCPYKSACRRGHPPSVARERQSTDAAGYRGLGGKSTRRPNG
jgi:ATP-dependent helicase/nuclease subunit B